MQYCIAYCAPRQWTGAPKEFSKRRMAACKIDSRRFTPRTDTVLAAANGAGVVEADIELEEGEFFDKCVHSARRKKYRYSAPNGIK